MKGKVLLEKGKLLRVGRKEKKSPTVERKAAVGRKK